MLQLVNRSGFSVRLLVLPDRHGRDAALIVIKGAWSLRDGSRLPESPPIIEADVWAGEPGASPLVTASDLALEKPATDVLLVGSAHAPRGVAQAAVDVSVRVGPMRKALRVCGARTWAKGLFGDKPSAPEPFVSQPLAWAADDELPPVLEDPDRPTGRRSAVRTPWGCGPVPPTAPSRQAHAGTYDAAWQRDRAPFLPSDFDPRFFQVAPVDQQVLGHLRGGEELELVNLTADGLRQTTLPRCSPRCQATIVGQVDELPLRLDTVLLLPDAEQIVLTWRGLLPLGRRILQLSQVSIDV